MPDARDEFFIGYLDAVPPGLARAIRGWIPILFGIAAAVAALIAVGQGPFTPSSYEWGIVREWEGVLVEGPVPALRVARPGQVGAPALPGVSTYTLVDVGKFGAADKIAGLDGRRVRLSGSLVFRDGETMIELADTPVALADGALAGAAALPLGRHVLDGQIVDTKCYLGVMNPADTKTHRACAIRCISGGIPPGFRVRADDGSERLLMLIGADGRALNAEVLPFVAEPLRVSGEVAGRDGLLVLRAEPAEFVRLRD